MEGRSRTIVRGKKNETPIKGRKMPGCWKAKKNTGVFKKTMEKERQSQTVRGGSESPKPL